MACLPPPIKWPPPRPRVVFAGVVGCLRGWPRPRLAGGESGPSRRAFPFSAAENLFMGTVGRDEPRGRRRRRGGAREDGLEGLVPFRTYSRRRPTVGLHDRR